jgi:predicted metal-dependent peptidase
VQEAVEEVSAPGLGAAKRADSNLTLQEYLETTLPLPRARDVFGHSDFDRQCRLTRLKPNRRYGFQYMGSRYDFTTRLLFAVDVSGSMSSPDLASGFSVINRFFKYGVEAMDVIQFDTEIQGEPRTLKRARHDIEVSGRGGTDFTAVIEFLNEHHDYDGAIIFTDGYAPVPPRPKNRRTRLLWLFNHEETYRRQHEALRTLGRAAYLKETETIT